jgi:hypothetical protein
MSVKLTKLKKAPSIVEWGEAQSSCELKALRAGSMPIFGEQAVKGLII